MKHIKYLIKMVLWLRSKIVCRVVLGAINFYLSSNMWHSKRNIVKF